MANIKGKGTLYKNQFGWSISHTKKDKNGDQQLFYIGVKFTKEAEQRAEDRKFIEYEGFTSPYKTREGKTMLEFVITHILKDKEESDKSEYVATSQNQEEPDFNIGKQVDISNDDLPF